MTINMNTNIGFLIRIKAKFNNDIIAHYSVVQVYDIDEYEDYIEDMDDDDWIKGIIKELNPYEAPLAYVAQVSILSSVEMDPCIIRG